MLCVWDRKRVFVECEQQKCGSAEAVVEQKADKRMSFIHHSECYTLTCPGSDFPLPSLHDVDLMGAPAGLWTCSQVPPGTMWG